MRDVLRAAAAQRIGKGAAPVVEFFDGWKHPADAIANELELPARFFGAGTTGVSKPCLIDEANWERRIPRQGGRLLRNGKPFTSIKSLFVTFGSSDANYLYCMNKYLMILAGGTLFHPGSRNYPFVKFLEECRDRSIEAYVVSAKDGDPVFTVMLRYSNVHRFKYLIWGGSQITKSLVDMAKANLADEVYVNYGITEVGSVAFADCDQVVDREPGCVGHVARDLEVRIDDGLIAIRGDTVVKGYVDEGAKLNATSFRDGWFYPGDRGHFDADGMLVIDGRAA